MFKLLRSFGVFALVAILSGIGTAQEPVGTWEGETDQGPFSITVVKDADGSLAGTMDAGPLGEVDLADVAAEGNTLTWNVDLDFGGQAVSIDFSGDIDGDSIDGNLSIPDFGDFPIELSRAAADSPTGLAGEWDLEFDIQGNPVTAKMILVKAADGSYSGSWESQFGASDLDNISVDGLTATFSRELSAQGQDMTIDYTAVADGNSISGTLDIPQLGEVPFSGKRVGGAGGHVGTWALSLDAGGQIFEIELTVAEEDGELAISTSTQLGDVEGTDAKFEDGVLTFNVTVDLADVVEAGGEMMEVAYSLTIDGDSISGTVTTDAFGENAVEGERSAS